MALYRRKKRHFALKTDINVTPFVDVMLVLLIVFMVSTPMMQSGIPIDVPSGKAGKADLEASAPLVVSLNHEGELFLKEEKVTEEGLVQKLIHHADQPQNQVIYLRADQTLAYAKIVHLLNVLAGRGFSKVMLVMKQEG